MNELKATEAIEKDSLMEAGVYYADSAMPNNQHKGWVSLSKNELVIKGEEITYVIPLQGITAVKQHFNWLYIHFDNQIVHFRINYHEQINENQHQYISQDDEITKWNDALLSMLPHLSACKTKPVEWNSLDSKFGKTVGVAFIVLALLLGVLKIMDIIDGAPVKDDIYISCAKSVISQALKSPATAVYSNGAVVERDNYGRVIVTIQVDAQNAFGAYMRNYFAVMINSYDKKSEVFTWNRAFGVQAVDNPSQYETVIKMMKNMLSWDEPIAANKGV